MIDVLFCLSDQLKKVNNSTCLAKGVSYIEEAKAFHP